MSIKLTAEQRQALPDEVETPVEVLDDRGRRYYMVSEATYRKFRAVLEAEEIDPSLYEFDESQGGP
ncbi:MAG: hypothetical protein WED34_09655 [Planctomycetales bacterium]